MPDKRLKLYMFCCSTSVDTQELTCRLSGHTESEIKIISLPCSGKVNILYLLKAFETGADGVAVVTCKEGECSYLEGDLRARKRAEAVDSLIEEIGLGRGRIAVIQMNDGGHEQLIREVQDFLSEIRKITT